MTGNVFKQRFVFILILVSSVFLSASFVSAATYDASGQWFLTISNGWTDGGIDCPAEEDKTITCTITQNGDSATLVVHEADGDITLDGSVTDSNYSLSASWTEDDGNQITVSATTTLSSSTSGSGQVDISVFDPNANTTCQKGMDITLTKEGIVPTYDATGEWDVASLNFWVDGPPECGEPDADETNTATITQTGNNVTIVVHDDDGDETYTGIVSGDIYSFDDSWTDGGETETIDVIFSLSSNSSGTGNGTFSWTDGVVTCIGGFDLTLTKQVVPPAGGGGGGGGCFITTLLSP